MLNIDSADDGLTIVFTDGAAKGNPGPGGWGVVIVTPDAFVRELGGGSPHTTNNRMELSGAIAALTDVPHDAKRIAMYTDSTYVIQGITQWVHGWKRRGWKTAQGSDVLNRDLWEELAALVAARGPKAIEWRWVRGHQGTPGNERCDEIAVAFSLQELPTLYRGPLDGYTHAIHEVPDATALPARTASSSPARRAGGGRPHSYLSVVDGVPMRHATWAECEQRVKGRSGARFKKAASVADEAAILRGWGIDPQRL